jgi:2-polyprenyl-6-hydroxyphenyl methylase/3-demethylubiquinone-9 3-methyltransferase
MSAYRDFIDWVGGYPFEVASPDEVFHFFKKDGYSLTKIISCSGGQWCNEYVFIKQE